MTSQIFTQSLATDFASVTSTSRQFTSQKRHKQGVEGANCDQLQPVSDARSLREGSVLPTLFIPSRNLSYILYRVRTVILFGSFLTDAQCVVDLDLAVGLESKEPDRTKAVDMDLARGNDAARRGKALLQFPRTAVLRRIGSEVVSEGPLPDHPDDRSERRRSASAIRMRFGSGFRGQCRHHVTGQGFVDVGPAISADVFLCGCRTSLGIGTCTQQL